MVTKYLDGANKDRRKKYLLSYLRWENKLYILYLRIVLFWLKFYFTFFPFLFHFTVQ